MHCWPGTPLAVCADVLDARLYRPETGRVILDGLPGASTSRRRRWYVWAAGATLAIVLIWPVRTWYIHHARGNPDPGGKRLGYLRQVAGRAVPPGATNEHLHLTLSRWERGGCDGGPDGWSRIEVDQAFRATKGAISQIDAAMLRQHWRPLPPKGGTAVREYEPVGNTFDAYGWLNSTVDADGTTWELDLSAGPAENPSDAC